MQTSTKYLIHADIRTNGVVERSDVVGAIFGQTEGLLGEQLDLRDLQDSSKVGRIDVHVESEGGRSFGTVTIASGLDRVETTVLAAALETIERVGPCRADCTVTHIEDARAAKRRALIDRATELLEELEGTTVTSEQLVEEVRQQVRVEEITDYEGLPAGPRVEDSDAIIVVEGRADVRRLLKYGIKNAIAVEGTDIPEAIANLTRERTTTAFLDGDRGGDLVLRELQQVGDVDYVAFAPAGESVEDLDRATIRSALRRKIPFEQVTGEKSAREVFEPSEVDDVESTGSTSPESDGEAAETAPKTGKESTGETTNENVESQMSDPQSGGDSDGQPARSDEQAESASDGQIGSRTDERVAGAEGAANQRVEYEEHEVPSGEGDGNELNAAGENQEPETLPGHVEEIVTGKSKKARLLDGAFGVLAEVDAEEAFDAINDADDVPAIVVLDGTVSQRLLDVAAQRGVGEIWAADTGEFVKQPTSIRVRTADELDV